MILRHASCLKLIAVRNEAMIQSYNDNSGNLPGDFYVVVNLSWYWCSRVASPARHVLCRRSESLEEAQTVLVHIAYL